MGGDSEGESEGEGEGKSSRALLDLILNQSINQLASAPSLLNLIFNQSINPSIDRSVGECSQLTRLDLQIQWRLRPQGRVEVHLEQPWSCQGRDSIAQRVWGDRTIRGRQHAKGSSACDIGVCCYLHCRQSSRRSRRPGGKVKVRAREREGWWV